MPPYASIQHSLDGLKPGSRLILKPARHFVSHLQTLCTHKIKVFRLALVCFHAALSEECDCYVSSADNQWLKEDWLARLTSIAI